MEHLRASFQELWKSVEPMLEIKDVNASLVESLEEVKAGRLQLENTVECLRVEKSELNGKFETVKAKLLCFNNELAGVKELLALQKEQLIASIAALTQQMTSCSKEIAEKLNCSKIQSKQQNDLYE